MLPQITKFALFFCIIFASSCKKNREAQQARTVPAPAPEQVIPKPALTYSLLKANLKTLDSQFSVGNLQILLALNRADRGAVRRIDTLVCPDTFLPDLSAYSPFPATLPLIDSVKKFLVFSYQVQGFAAYENGRQVKWGPTSLGKASTPTQTGLFHTNWKAKRTVSTVNKDWILGWCFNIDNKTGVSIHQFELPGYPASHACARLREEDAKWIYDWAEQWKLSPNHQQVLLYGTPVLVFGSYDFKKKLRHNLFIGNKAIMISQDSLQREIASYLPEILQKQADRESAQLSDTATIMP